MVNGKIAFSRTFTIAAEVDNGGPAVTSVTWSGVKTQEIDFTVRGKNFQPNALVLIAHYRPAGGWTYLASLQPTANAPNQLSVHYAGLPANEYLVIVENPDQRMSRPMPFVIATGGYKLPTAAGIPWMITQGPYGTFSHWGNSLHAYDIAPRSGRCVVAMKAGIATRTISGLQQDHRHHSFGNYITIDHGNGEFSHYAHLATGTFVVKNGQRVEQGQALAIAGNSGYTLGEGGGYHVHVSVTRAMPITSPSVPFQFDDLGDLVARRPESHGHVGQLVAAVRLQRSATLPRRWPRIPPKRQFSGQVSVAQWWSEVVAVPRGAKVFEATLSWADAANRLDLHLVSPSGRHYGWYGDHHRLLGPGHQSPGISSAEARTRAVADLGGGPPRRAGPIDFSVNTSGSKSGSGLLAAGRQ